MQMIRNIAVCTLALGLCVCCGCVNLKPQPDMTRFFVLAADLVPSATAGDTQQGLALGMRRLQLAPHLDTPSIVVRRGLHEISFSDLYRWGEDLETGIARTLADYLASTASVGSVDIVPWPDRAVHDFVIAIRIQRFEGEIPDVARLLASWTIHHPDDGRVLKQGITDQSTSGWIAEDYADLVKKLDASLRILAADLAAELGKLDQP